MKKSTQLNKSKLSVGGKKKFFTSLSSEICDEPQDFNIVCGATNYTTKDNSTFASLDEKIL